MSYRLLLALSLTTLLLDFPVGRAQAPGPSPATRFQFREPRPVGYLVPLPALARVKSSDRLAEWIEAQPENGSTNAVQFGSRVVLQVGAVKDLDVLLLGRPLQLARRVRDDLCILQAPDAWTALRQAQELSQDPRVKASYPMARRPKQLLSSYAAKPNDPLAFRPENGTGRWQAHLENRDTNGVRQGLDLNVRAAWPISRGQGVLMAIADDGFEINHPDLVSRTQGAPHFNFDSGEPDGTPPSLAAFHATAVAGLAAATSNNGLGISGVAPEAQLASWVIFGATGSVVSEEALMEMFQYQSNIVSVQNHSWGKVGAEQVPLGLLEDVAISNAVHVGRSGLGVVMVRAGGNGRLDGNDANDDGYLADPRVIAVAAARLDGKVAGYSSPGANLLVAGMGGDLDATYRPCLPASPNLVTTDRQGTGGSNKDPSTNGDYALGLNGFSGTSGATPQIAGVAALILSANTNLTSRDVQQILIHSARFWDLSDPTLATNAAGFRVSHNLGFGVPDAGLAVALARFWTNRPPSTTVTYGATDAVTIPDLGLRLLVQGTDAPTNLMSIVAVPGSGPQPDNRTALVPLVDVGGAVGTITNDLRGKAALIQRGGNFFCQKIQFAAEAGAEFAVIYNNTGRTVRQSMGSTDLTPIPSLFINQNDGEALRDYLAATPDVRAQINRVSTNYSFQVTDTLQCEFVGVHLDSDHTARGDLHIILTSPAGTRSVLQRVSLDTLPGPRNWTYYSVQNFYESSFGTWNLSISDEDINGTGSILSASLILTGVPITDTDHDGLDDEWEQRWFHTLAYGPQDDPDQDGYNNAREQILRTDPTRPNSPFQLDLSVWDQRLVRLSWPGRTNLFYHVQAGLDAVVPLAPASDVPGQFPETEWFVPYTNRVQQFFEVISGPTP